MKLWKKILAGVGAFILALIALFVIFIGPWPTYSDGFEGKGYFTKALADIDQNVKESEITDSPGRLQAGWGVANITPEIGVPMAGYGARKGAPTTGVHDDLLVKAIAFSDGKDTAVVVGADMLIIPPNIAEAVRQAVAKETPLTPNDIHFGASHTHDGAGAFGPGLASWVTGGKYDPKVPEFLAKQFTSAIVDACKSMGPAKMAHGGVNAEKYIRNRARGNGPVDGELSYMVIEKDDGKRCFLVSFSAHPTIVDSDFMQFTAEYPGGLQRAIEKATGATCAYLGGALGSMSPNNKPDGPDAVSQAQAYGELLAQLVLDNTTNLQFRDKVDVVSIGIPLQLPPFQVRLLSTKWRLSPLAAGIAGLQTTGWMQATRVGDAVFVGIPGDFSGEISRKWKQWGDTRGFDLWTSSFCAAYAGYISPDEYYNEVVDEKGNTEYETGAMSWVGPHQEAYFTALMQKMVESTGKTPLQQQANQPVPAEADAKSSS